MTNYAFFSAIEHVLCAKTHKQAHIFYELNYNINQKQQTLIDSWPSQLNQDTATHDWGWNPKYNFDDAFDNYLIPNIKKKYKG